MATVGKSGDRDAVEALFGDLVDEVALEAPVSRDGLVDGLVAAETHGPDHVDGEVVRGHRVVTLSVSRWERVADRADLRAAVALAVRVVHRRMVEALGATEAVAVGTDPYVVTDA